MNSRMRLSLVLLVVFTVLVATRPRLVDCRLLQSPIKTEKATHQPLKLLQFLWNSVITQKANTEDTISSRVLIENQYHTMSSGPSRRGSGH
ncbi:hypothetical protein VNO77_25214 [Canavalia gladiata]|uniref:Secreted protein n=1 Tax=Canavalia gladiata TaxID=3824 RepID=A0AAN9L7R1_CANGL